MKVSIDSPDQAKTLVPPALVELVTTGASRRARRLLGAYAAAVAAHTVWSQVQQRRAQANTYSVAAITKDEAPANRSTLRATLTPGQATQANIGGHPVAVEVEQPAVRDNDDSRRFSDERIVFKAKSRPGREAVLAWLHDLAVEQQSHGPRLQVIDHWGDTRTVGLTARPWDTVALPDEQRARLEDDLRWFLSSEEQHAALGLPWHRGYLFHGPPGTGKTTTARALATHFNLDLVYLPLAAVSTDFSLLRMLLNLPGRSVLLIEDIDIVAAAHDRTDSDAKPSGGFDGLSLQGLLNGLDGIATPHGLITICTTNNPDVLDPALMRPGRLDVQEEFGPLTADALRYLLNLLGTGMSRPELAAAVRREVTASAVIEAAKPYLADSFQVERTDAVRQLLGVPRNRKATA